MTVSRCRYFHTSASYLLSSLLHSCSIFVISSALSNITEPLGKISSFSKKLDFTADTSSGRTFHSYAFNLSPSNLLLLGEYPRSPSLKKAEELFKFSKIELSLNSKVSLASIDIWVLSELLKSM